MPIAFVLPFSFLSPERCIESTSLLRQSPTYTTVYRRVKWYALSLSRCFDPDINRLGTHDWTKQLVSEVCGSIQVFPDPFQVPLLPSMKHTPARPGYEWFRLFLRIHCRAHRTSTDRRRLAWTNQLVSKVCGSTRVCTDPFQVPLLPSMKHIPVQLGYEWF